MGKRIVAASAILFCLAAVSHAGLMDDIGGLTGGGKAPGVSGSVADDAKVVSGLKEALSVGTANTVASTRGAQRVPRSGVAALNGYPGGPFR